MSNNFKENLAQERLECQDRMERRAIRDRIAIDRGQAVKHSMLRQDLTLWLDSRMKSVEDSANRSQVEQVALLRTLLRGSSKRRRRALRSELTSGMDFYEYHISLNSMRIHYYFQTALSVPTNQGSTLFFTHLNF